MSDKSVNAKMGRRTKFIFWGSIAAAVSLIILAIFEVIEFQKIMAAGYADTAKLVEASPDGILGGLLTDAGLCRKKQTRQELFSYSRVATYRFFAPQSFLFS